MSMDVMLAPELIAKVIGHVDTVEDLKTFRLVSKQWNFFTTRALHGHTSLSLQVSTEKKLLDFLLCFEKRLTADIPFSSFHFRLDTIQCSALIDLFLSTYGSAIQKVVLQREMDSSLVISFLQQSSNLRILELTISDFMNLSDWYRTKFEMQKFYSLTSLTLTIPIPYYGHGTTPNCLHCLRQCTPSLQEVLITSRENLGQVAEIIFMFSDMQILKVRQVQFATTNSGDIKFLQDAKSKNLQLTELYVRLSHDTIKASRHLTFDYDRVRTIFSEFMETQSGTLEKLTIMLEKSASGFQIPPLPKLRSLGLWLCRSEYVERPFLQMTAMRFPNLLELDLMGSYHRSPYLEDWSCIGTEPFIWVNHLDITEYHKQNVNLDFEVLFPSLASLALNVVDDELFKFFLERFTHLKHLRLSFRTGDKVNGVNICQCLGGSGYADDENGDSPPYVTTHGLAQFKHLETLELGYFEFQYKESLSASWLRWLQQKL